ncbi:hypothetical protein [Gordonia sp. WA4-43]|uniref:hypothetical protein n=1 Tax=Gordonia sp. WA4-43 TaxID=2878678 RepID=UPI001CFAD148|nr:hypothetical protein [Gordonia sp. WA4-43]UCZ90480.1 hypothetical protein LEL84_01910 [Gordonia sp. WA4-43]
MTDNNDVLALLGRSGDTDLVTVAQQAQQVVTAQVWAYTRGRGFSGEQPAPDIDTVILTSTARLVANPENLRSEKIGDYEVQRQVVEGWTLAELAILNRYRRRAR